MSLHHDPVSGFTSHEPDHHALTKVKREPDITAHLWCTQDSREEADRIAERRRRDASCAVCGRRGAFIVDAVTVDIKPLGASLTVHAVVIRHLREGL